MTWLFVDDQKATSEEGFVLYAPSVEDGGSHFYFEWNVPLCDLYPLGPEFYLYVSVGRVIDALRAHGYEIEVPAGAPEPSIWDDDSDEQTLDSREHGVVSAYDFEVPTSVIAELLRRQGYAVCEPGAGYAFDAVAQAIVGYELASLDTESANQSLRWTAAYRLVRCHGLAGLEASHDGRALVATCRRGGVQEFDLDTFRRRRRLLPCRLRDRPRSGSPGPASRAHSPDGHWRVEARPLDWPRGDRTVTRPGLRVTENRADGAGDERIELAGPPIFVTWRGDRILVGLEDGTIHVYQYEP